MTDSRSPVIELDQVQFRWNKGPVVLDISDFRINRGEKVFIKGPSGSGKTTLLGIMGGVLMPERGAVNVLGTDFCGLSQAQRDHFRASHIGFIFQMFNLIPYLSVIENITLPLGFSDQRQHSVQQSGRGATEEAQRLLAHLELTDPDQLKRNVTELSIGQQQRVAAARALIGKPDLVIADEPTSALDSDTREAFIRLLFDECDAAENTLVFVSHDSTLEHLFDRTIALQDINRASSHKPQGASV